MKINLNPAKHFVLGLCKKLYIQAALVGLLTILPFSIYVLATNSIIAPLNIIDGWDVSSAQGRVIAPTPSDVNQQMLPFRQYIKDSLLIYHELPLWNNRSFAGDVFFANPINTPFSPFNILLLVVDIYSFQNIIVLLGIFLMSTCMYLLLRSMKMSAIASTFGAIAYSLAPFSVFWSIYGIVSIPMAAMPLTLYFYNRWKSDIRRFNRYLIYTALTLGVVVYTGHIQVALLSYIVLFVAVLYDVIFKRQLKTLPYMGAVFAVAILIGLAQTLPMVMQTPLSHRSDETTVYGPRPWGERLGELSQIPVAYPLASGPAALGQTSRRVLSIGQIPGILLIVSVIAMTLAAIRRKKIGGTLFYVFLFVLGAFWQWNDFPQTLLNKLSPTFQSLATDYFLPIALLGMSVMAAYALDQLMRYFFKKSSQRSRYYLEIILAILPILGLIIISSPQFSFHRLATLGVRYYIFYYASIILVCLYFIVRRNIYASRVGFGVTLALIALLQGWALYRVSQPIVPREITETRHPLLNYITAREQKPVTIVDYVGPQESTLYNVSLINGYDSLYSSSILKRIQAINYPNPTPPSYRNNALSIVTNNKPTLFQNLGVAYTINRQPLSGYTQQIPGVFKTDQPSPEIYFAKSIRAISQTEQLETLKSGKVEYHEVVVDHSYPVAAASSTVKYERTSNSLTLYTSSPNGGLLFIAQTYSKDWKGTIDSTDSISLVPAYYDFTAINIPAGSHTIRLTYQPPLFPLIATVSALSLTICGLVLIYIRKLNYHQSNKY